MKILITGINGNLGRYCANHFSSKGFKVVGLSRTSDNFFKNKNITVISYQNISKIESYLEEVEVVLHFAASTGFNKSDYEYIDSNLISTLKLIELIKKNKKNNINRILFTSTSSVYGEGQYLCNNHQIVTKVTRRIFDLENKNWEPFCPLCNSKIIPTFTNEDCETSNQHIYAITKNMSENIFRNFSSEYNINTTILRLPVLFGNKNGEGIISVFVNKIINNEKIFLNEDGNQLRDFLSYENLVKVIDYLAFNKSKRLIYNIGSGSSISLIKLIEFISNEVKFKANIEISNKYREGDVRNIFLDNKLFTREFSNLSLRSFESNLSLTIKDIISEKN